MVPSVIKPRCLFIDPSKHPILPTSAVDTHRQEAMPEFLTEEEPCPSPTTATWTRYNPCSHKSSICWRTGDIGSRTIKPKRKKQSTELQQDPTIDSVTHLSPAQDSTTDSATQPLLAPIPKYPSTTKGMKRKMHNLESGVMALNDQLIDLEVMIQEKDKTIDYQGNCILSLKKQNSENKKQST